MSRLQNPEDLLTKCSIGIRELSRDRLLCSSLLDKFEFRCIIKNILSKAQSSNEVYLHEIVADVPLWSSKSSHPQAFHMDRRTWIYDELSIVALSNWTVLMPKKYCRTFLH